MNFSINPFPSMQNNTAQGLAQQPPEGTLPRLNRNTTPQATGGLGELSAIRLGSALIRLAIAKSASRARQAVAERERLRTIPVFSNELREQAHEVARSVFRYIRENRRQIPWNETLPLRRDEGGGSNQTAYSGRARNGNWHQIPTGNISVFTIRNYRDELKAKIDSGNYTPRDTIHYGVLSRLQTLGGESQGWDETTFIEKFKSVMDEANSERAAGRRPCSHVARLAELIETGEARGAINQP